MKSSLAGSAMVHAIQKQLRYSVYLPYWYKSTDTHAQGAGSAMVHAIQKQLEKFVGAKRCEFTRFTCFASTVFLGTSTHLPRKRLLAKQVK